MLGIMRKYKQSIIIKGVFIIIVLSFIGTIFLVWGKGDKGLGGSGFAAKVDRTAISLNEFEQNYRRLREMYQQYIRQPLTPEMEKQLGLRKLALENLINTVLIRNDARRMGIEVSNDEVRNAIAAIPAFQRNGAFDGNVYQQMLQMKRMTPKEFESDVKEELLLKKARQKIMDEVKVTDAEALQIYKKKHDRIDLLFAAFNPAVVRPEVKPSEADLQAYLQNHQQAFMLPEEVSISYVVVTPDRAAGAVTVSNEEMLNYYQKNMDQYQDNKGGFFPFDEVRDRVKTDTMKFKASKQAYEMAADALNKSLKTGGLNEASRILGERVEKTGLFTAQHPPAQLAGETAIVKRAFSMRNGELGGPVETKKGVYILTVNEKKAAATPPLAQVRSRIEKLVMDQKAQDLAYQKAQQALIQLSKGTAPSRLQETGLFQYSDNGDIPRIGKSPEIMEAAFALTPSAPTPKGVFRSGDTWYGIKLKSRVEADTADFQKNKEQIKQSVLPQKREEAVANWLKSLRSKARIQRNEDILKDQL